MMIFIPQLPHRIVAGVCKQFGFRIPEYVNKSPCTQELLDSGTVRWNFGHYYTYGNKDSWIPLARMGGMAHRPFASFSVVFPPEVDAILRDLIHDEREALKIKPNYRLNGCTGLHGRSGTGKGKG